MNHSATSEEITGPALTDCGCAARVHADGSGVEIDYCPLHDAADELLDGLKKAADTFADIARVMRLFNRETVAVSCDVAREGCEASIAKAEGRS